MRTLNLPIDIKARSIGGDHWLDGSRGLIKTKVYPTESNINTTRTKKIHTLLINIIYIYHDQSRHQRIEERPEICGRRRSCWGSKFRSTCKTIGWICWDSTAAGKKLQTQLCLCISYIYNIYTYIYFNSPCSHYISICISCSYIVWPWCLVCILRYAVLHRWWDHWSYPDGCTNSCKSKI